MNIEDVKKQLSNTYVKSVVDNIEDVIDRINYVSSNNITVIRDVVLSSNDDEYRQLIHQSIFALNDVGAINIEFVCATNHLSKIKHTGTYKPVLSDLLPFDKVAAFLTDEEPNISYDQEGQTITIPKKYIEMAIVHPN